VRASRPIALISIFRCRRRADLQVESIATLAYIFAGSVVPVGSAVRVLTEKQIEAEITLRDRPHRSLVVFDRDESGSGLRTGIRFCWCPQAVEEPVAWHGRS